MARTPSPEPARPQEGDSDSAPSEDLPTLRVPVRPPPGVGAPGSPRPALAPRTMPAPHPLGSTPPPLDDLQLSATSWSDGGTGIPATRYAPRVGDTILGFKLVGELGRGAFARVFLAEQQALANRQVALKVTLRPTREAERLARLQHTNIVPVYSVHDEAPVQVICMPYLGRVTLADLIRAYRSEHPSRHSGRKSTSARAARTTGVDSRSKSHSKSATDSNGGTTSTRVATWTWTTADPPPIVGDPRGVLELLAQLAAGLTHAHERGILHLDIKPANVLLADTGEPMLLDFNLSFDSARPDRELVGGTMPYMAIEQLFDMRNRGKGRIDARTDLFSLGVLAFEMLTGTVPFPASAKQVRDIDGQVAARRAGPPSIRALNPAVTPAVEAIIRKLLAAEPADRYQSAEELRIDAERQLNDQSLKYARETSVKERLGKWRRRNPRLPMRLLVAGLVVCALGLGAYAHDRAEGQARVEEANARIAAVQQAKSVHAALDTTRLDLILPDDGKSRTRGVARAMELLAPYGLPGDADWQKRPDVRRLSETERAELAGDLGELMVLLAQAKWLNAAGKPEAERREITAEAWKLNTAARTCFGDSQSPTLDRQATLLAPTVGETFVSKAEAQAEPGDPRELFLAAATAIPQGRYAKAIPLLDRVMTARPNHAAAQFLLALCLQQTGHYLRALERFDVARTMLPNDPRPSHQRGIIHGITLQPALAEEEFTKAIAIDPAFADAYRNRSLARYRQGVMKSDANHVKEAATKLAGAEKDLTTALACGTSALFVHSVRAQVRDARGNKAGADADRAATKDIVLKTEQDYLVHGWSLIQRDPKGALADFQKAAEINPRSLIALQNQAHVLADRLKNLDAALVVATKAAQLYPEFAPAVAGRAVVLARLGKREEAHKEIERARLLSDDPRITYQAACVYAITSAQNAEDKPIAVTLLRKAIRDGHGEVKNLATDHDLDALRNSREFLDIQQAASSLYR